MASAEEKKAFKDWFDRAAVRMLGKQIQSVYPEFELEKFVRRASAGLEGSEMMDRVRQISNTLRAHLPDSTAEALELVTRSLPPALPDCDAVTDGWLQWPIGQLIADHGVEEFEPAMTAMYELTQRFSSEFAVRPFIERYPKKTLSRLKKWTRDPNPHVRRWCSEGCRPRLPWGVRLNDLVDDPAPCLEIIERLKDDPELYVRRSVANNLNDIAKDHPEIVVETCRRWWSDGSQERRWIVQHALRSLIKKGHPGALDVLGYGAPKNIAATLKVTPKRVRVGEDVRLNLQLEGAAKQPLMVDYGIHYVLANGKTGRKVFKWKKLDAKSEGVLEKKHSMRETTIRTLRPGRHRVDVQINGHVVAESYFDLRE